MTPLAHRARAVIGPIRHIFVDRLKQLAYPRAMTDVIDARGLLCPLPVLRLRKRMRALHVGERITLLADDPAAVIDVPHYCAESGNLLVETRPEEGATAYLVEKA